MSNEKKKPKQIKTTKLLHQDFLKLVRGLCLTPLH